MKLMIAAGGTGGHIFPGVAVAEALKKKDSASEVVFVGTDIGLEAEILKKENLPHLALKVGRLKGEGFAQRLKTFVRLPGSLLQARAILSEFKPDVVLGIGGYSSGPVILAAMLKRIPRAILEPNAIPGFTNRILGRFVGRICISFAETGRFFAKSKTLLTGTPVRRALTEIGETRESKTATDRPFTILVFGGSQGASALNKAMVALLPALESAGKKFKIIHQTGANDIDWVRKAYESSKLPSVVQPFIVDMTSVYREADLVVSRAGASSIAELIETRSASILVPYPFAADDHQRFNAQSLSGIGAAELIMNKDLETKLGVRILHYEAHRSELQTMREKLATLRKIPAAEAVVAECLAMAGVS
jgi:UDP-N-acetylglucosamine--N-acetylmuramyl-(pentapeptide) pyrophosphoryl-undecaprenol N-acetylglucosamine transferase